MTRQMQQGSVILVLALAVLVGSRCSAADSDTAPGGRDIYVSPNGQDINTGSKDHPLRTISQAARAAAPGTTIHVAVGTYYETIESFASGTAIARIRYVSDVKWGAKILATPAARTPYAWKQWGAYVDIVGFEVTGYVAYGIWSRGAHARIIGNHVHHIRNGQCVAGGGIMMGNWTTASDTDVIGNLVHDVGPAPGSCNKSHGIYCGQPRNRIANNIVFNSAGWGIHSWHGATDLVIANNLVFANGGSKPGGYSGGGINIGAGDDPGDVVNDNSFVANNIVFRNGGVGIREYGAVGKNNRYVNNLVYQNRKDLQMILGTAVGTIVADPQFLDFKMDGTGNYRLLPTSPAVGRGTREGAPEIDFDGSARPVDKSPDIGPFQSSAAVNASASKVPSNTRRQ